MEELGDHQNMFQKVCHAIAFPKLYTPHYNENGRQMYVSLTTVIFSFLMITTFILFALKNIIPVISSETITTTFKREGLANPISYFGNKSISYENQDHSMFAFFNVKKSTNFEYRDFQYSMFVETLKRLEIVNSTSDMFEDVTMTLVAPV